MRIQKYGHNLRRSLHDNRGTTMVETLVSFVVLMIILAVITGMIMFCSKLRMRAEDTSRAMTIFTAQINNKDNTVTKTVTEGNAGVDTKTFTANNIKVSRYTTGKEVLTDEEGRTISIKQNPLFYLVTPESATDESDDNYRKDYLSLYNIEADSYAYISNDGENLQYLQPKALRFIHKKDR